MTFYILNLSILQSLSKLLSLCTDEPFRLPLLRDPGVLHNNFMLLRLLMWSLTLRLHWRMQVLLYKL